MKNIKSLLAIMLAACLVLGLCACGGNTADTGDTTETTEATTETTEETTEAATDKTLYTVKVVDEDGNPVAGAMVQLCLDTCFPGATDENGVAEFSMEEADYKVSFLAVPEGYSADAEEYYFAEGATELTITLKAVA